MSKIITDNCFAMMQSINSELKRVGIHRDEGEIHSIECLQDSLQRMKKSSVREKTKSYILLLKHLPESLLESGSKEVHEVFRSAMETVKYDERNSSITMTLKASVFSIKDCLARILDEVFKGCGQRLLREGFIKKRRKNGKKLIS